MRPNLVFVLVVVAMGGSAQAAQQAAEATVTTETKTVTAGGTSPGTVTATATVTETEATVTATSTPAAAARSPATASDPRVRATIGVGWTLRIDDVVDFQVSDDHHLLVANDSWERYAVTPRTTNSTGPGVGCRGRRGLRGKDGQRI